MKIHLVFIFVLLIVGSSYSQDFGQNVVNAQKVEQVPQYLHQKFDAGFGFGLDYGGLTGLKVVYSPIKYLAVFASGGYHLVAFGWQTGVAGYALPRTNQKVFRLYGKVMYGSNRVIIVDGSSQYNKNYFGFTPGIGVEFRFGGLKKHGMNIDLNVPISSKEFTEDYDYLQNHTSIEMGPVSPVTISFGYHFVIF